MRAAFLSLLVSLVAAALVPTEAGAAAIPVSINAQPASPRVGDKLGLTLASPVGPCPSYNWSVQDQKQSRTSFAAAPSFDLNEPGPVATIGAGITEETA